MHRCAPVQPPTPAHKAPTLTAATETTPSTGNTDIDSLYERYQESAGTSDDELLDDEAPEPFSDYAIDTRYPFPQDMPLEKVATVVDLIDSGDMTDQDLSWSLNVSTQQGNYAANAAAYLGLVKRDKDTLPNTLTLTEAGEAFLAASPQERLAILGGLVDQMAADDVTDRGYSDTTTDYRKETASRWRNRIDEAGAADGIDVAARSALERARSSARPTRIRPRRPEPQYTMCQRCFMALPATGICDNCD